MNPNVRNTTPRNTTKNLMRDKPHETMVTSPHHEAMVMQPW